MAPTAGYAPQALTLRRFVIRLLTGQPTGPDGWEPPAVVDDAWSLFLRIEQCAAPVRSRLHSSTAFPETLDRFASVDVRRSLGARAQFERIAAIARDRGWTVVLLKGSVAIADGRPNYLQDVDVLVRPADADELAREIGKHLALHPAGRAQARHLPIMGGEFSLPVEVHLNLGSRGTGLSDSWSRIIPLESVPGLFRLAPRDHCRHMLNHVVIDHPDRRGRLRDALVLRDALAECSPADRLVMLREVSLSPYAEWLMAELNLVLGLSTGDRTDSFEPAAFTNYWLLEHTLPWARGRLPRVDQVHGTVWQWMLIRASGWRWRRWFIDVLKEPGANRSALRPIAWLERRAPRTGRTARLILRTLHYALALAVAWPLARLAKRAAKKAGVLHAG